MTRGYVCCFIFASLMTGCGITADQKTQIGMFAASTGVAVDASVEHMIDIRSQVIAIRKERIVLGDMKLKSKVNLETALKAEKIAQRVATLRLLNTYATSLRRTLALGEWYIGKQQKEVLEQLVDKYSPIVAGLAEHIEQDLSLIGNSPCWPEFRGGAEPGTALVNDKKKSGVLDVFCAQADSLREHALELLHCPDVYDETRDPKHCAAMTPDLQDRALDDYLEMNHAMDNAASFSTKGASIIHDLLAANNTMATVLGDETFTSEEIKVFDAAAAELTTMIKVLAQKRRE